MVLRDVAWERPFVACRCTSIPIRKIQTNKRTLWRGAGDSNEVTLLVA